MTLPDGLHRLSPARHCLVTGASGYVGRHLCRALLDQGHQVTALVNRRALDLEHARLNHRKVALDDPAALQAAMDGVDTVFHTAAVIALMGGSSASQAYRDAAWQTNVEGSRNVIAAARAAGVSRLVYTSSVDVTFDGGTAPAMDSASPYARECKSVYAETKIAAERLVLAASDGELQTCALRPDGIWGPPPNDMLDRFVEQLKAGRLKVRMGSPDTLQDNSHVWNLVHAHLLAAQALADGTIEGGKAWFISDGEPMNSFDFFAPLFPLFQQAMPTREVGRGLLAPVLRAWQAGHFRFGLPAPMLTPHELDKVTVTHYGSNAEAERDLGYRPLISVAQGMEAVVAAYAGQVPE